MTYQIWGNQAENKYRFCIHRGCIIALKALNDCDPSRTYLDISKYAEQERQLLLKGGEIVCIYDRLECIDEESRLLNNSAQLVDTSTNKFIQSLKVFKCWLKEDTKYNLIYNMNCDQQATVYSNFTDITSCKCIDSTTSFDLCLYLCNILPDNLLFR